jgi:hypothetical protein
MDGLCLVVTRRWRFVTSDRTFSSPDDARLDWNRGGAGEARRPPSSSGEAALSALGQGTVPVLAELRICLWMAFV